MKCRIFKFQIRHLHLKKEILNLIEDLESEPNFFFFANICSKHTKWYWWELIFHTQMNIMFALIYAFFVSLLRCFFFSVVLTGVFTRTQKFLKKKKKKSPTSSTDPYSQTFYSASLVFVWDLSHFIYVCVYVVWMLAFFLAWVCPWNLSSLDKLAFIRLIWCNICPVTAEGILFICPLSLGVSTSPEALLKFFYRCMRVKTEIFACINAVLHFQKPLRHCCEGAEREQIGTQLFIWEWPREMSAQMNVSWARY